MSALFSKIKFFSRNVCIHTGKVNNGRKIKHDISPWFTLLPKIKAKRTVKMKRYII